MEKNSMDLLQQALDILKKEDYNTAYAAMTGYLIAFADLKTAQAVLELVENRGN